MTTINVDKATWERLKILKLKYHANSYNAIIKDLVENPQL